MTAEGQVIDVASMSQSFPGVPLNAVPRDNILEAIDSAFRGGVECLIVEGRELSGKTVLASQFAKRHPDQALAIFATPTSRWCYDADIIQMDLAKQLAFVLRKKHFDATTDSDDATLRKLLFALQE
jgi:hypothetical protein